MSASNLHIAWARLFVRALAASGVTEMIVSPGSRSTPLALAIAELEGAGVRAHVIADERAAAFFALGQARVTGRPSALVCTSGTAGAHYLPAIIEAHQSFVPMIAVTADRPWELEDVAAPQTIDQTKLFGSFVRRYAELGLPDASPTAMRAVQRIAAQAVASSREPAPGPVHVNARFRKPLEPVDVRGPEAWEALANELSERAPTRVLASKRAPDAAVVREIAGHCARSERGIIACGPSPIAQGGGRDAILELARVTRFPLLAEATSQVRFGGARAGVVAPACFDAFLRAPSACARLAPDFILELGAPPTSTGYARYVEEHASVPRYVVNEHGYGDPTSSATAVIACDPSELARAVVAELSPRERSGAWSERFAAADRAAQAIVSRTLEGPLLSEGAIAREVLASCPEGSLLMIGNSSPVRDLDFACAPSGREVLVLHQRGASGIDGLVAGAAGSASVTDRDVTLLLGDVSLRHDLTSIGLLPANAIAVVVNNGGGRIFDQLPIASRPEAGAAYERFFATPLDVRFEDAARAFAVAYARAETTVELGRALGEARARGGAHVIEARCAPREGAAMLRRIWSEVRDSEGKDR